MNDYIYNSGIKIYRRPTMSKYTHRGYDFENSFNVRAVATPNLISILEDNTEKDKCVKCGEKTMYEKNVHIDRRMGYVEGAGQLCTSCGKEFTEGGN